MIKRYTEQFGVPLNPGVLRHQITWQHKVVSGQDTFGQPVYVWADVVTCAARVEQLMGHELVSAQQIWPDAQYKVTQHKTPSLSTAMRISWYIDGIVRELDVLDVQDQPGSGVQQTALAKDHQQ